MIGCRLNRQLPPGPIEIMVGAAKLQVRRAGGQAVAVAMRAAVGPIETIVSVAKVEVSRAGGQAVCFLKALCTTI